MDDTSPNQATHGADRLSIFVTSVCAAICVAGGFGIVFQAFIVSASAMFELGHNLVLAGSVLNAAVTLWLFLWCFARSWHVERRLKQGLEVDEPKLSILANLKGYGPSPAKP
jgi:hypothetical protein